MTQTPAIIVTGYSKGGCCMHCGRELLHCVQTDAGVFGARCFAAKVTAPRSYRGKSYRLSTDAVLDLAKRAHNPAHYGISAEALTFQAA
ncbi:MAG: hypothetical protein KGR68_09170 [Betaproteobacteria bacterium]|nr:hypothetical protein [Betaproteobacteria bacterium]